MADPPRSTTGPAAERAPRAVGRRGVWLAAAVASLLACLPLRGGLLAGAGAVTMGVDTGTVGEPWRTVIEAEGGAVERPRNPELSDQGVGFYPLYRWVSDSWLAGDRPFWIPLYYCGAPGLGNPQSGVVDPQVWVLVLARALGGLDGFHIAIDLLAWARLAAAGLGAYLLARVLGLERPGAALAGVGFATSGFLVLWLHHSLSHVTPFLPWILLGLEGTRGARPGRAAVGAALALSCAILGGHPETAFYVGAAAGLWSLTLLRTSRRAFAHGFAGLALGSLLSAPMMLPFLEYLGRSGAQATRETSIGHDVVSLGGLAAIGVLLLGVATFALARSKRRPTLWIGVGVVDFAVGCWLLTKVGLPATAGVNLVGDLYGRPGAGSGWYGQGSYLEEASGWLAGPVAMLALGALVSLPRHVRHPRLLLGLGWVAFALVLRAPGLLELKQELPVVGLGATVRLAAVSALFLSLAAGAALDAAALRPRLAALLMFGGLLAATTLGGTTQSAPPAEALESRSDGLLTFTTVPPAALDGAEPRLEGWIAAEVPVERLSVRVTPIAGDGALDLDRRFDVPAERIDGSARPDAPPGAQWFRTPYLQTSRLDRGWWAFDLEVYGPDPTEPLAVRRASAGRVRRAPSGSTAGWVLLGLSAVAVLAAGGRKARWLTVAVAAAHGLWFAETANPPVPAPELFPETATERIVLREQGFHRFFGEPRTLWPDTGLVRGLRSLDGYDGLDPVDYNQYRLLVVKPGLNALLAWNARGVDLDATPFHLLGVKHLVLRDALEHPDWRLIAGPEPEHPEYAETWIYQAREPLSRAFITTEALAPREVAELANWDPLVTAATLADWATTAPATTAKAEVVDWSNTSVTADTALDGDGLLVLTEQFWPGWTATVDGAPTEVFLVDGIFRGVALEAGEHQVEFRYRPSGWRLGLALALAAAAMLAFAARR